LAAEVLLSDEDELFESDVDESDELLLSDEDDELSEPLFESDELLDEDDLDFPLPLRLSVL
jgi:hypothetical protein